MRDFYNEIKDENFKNLTYGLFNMIEDDGFVYYANHLVKEKLSIDDFEVMYFELTDKEKFLLRMRNKDFKQNFVILKQKLSKCDTIRMYIEFDNGKSYVIRVKKELLNN